MRWRCMGHLFHPICYWFTTEQLAIAHYFRPLFLSFDLSHNGLRVLTVFEDVGGRGGQSFCLGVYRQFFYLRKRFCEQWFETRPPVIFKVQRETWMRGLSHFSWRRASLALLNLNWLFRPLYSDPMNPGGALQGQPPGGIFSSNACQFNSAKKRLKKTFEMYKPKSRNSPKPLRPLLKWRSHSNCADITVVIKAFVMKDME